MGQEKISYQEICYQGKRIACQNTESFEREENVQHTDYPNGYQERLLVSPFCFYLGYLDAIHGLKNEHMVSTLIETAEQSFPVSFTEKQKKVLMKHYAIGHQEGVTLLQLNQAYYDYQAFNMKLDQIPEELKLGIYNIFSIYPGFDNAKKKVK